MFSTIVENVRSFFSREDELSSRPKDLPEPASEVIPRNPQPSIPERIVERPLPEKKTLPFTPEELKAALPKPVAKPEPIDISHEIHAFEDALQFVHDEPEPEPVIAKPSAPQKPSTQPSFFDEFSQFALREDLDAEGLLESDVLHRMREFHKHLKEGKEYYVYSTDVRSAIDRKLAELKTLENEWFHTRSQLDEYERGLSQLETEIESRTQELRTLVKQARTKSKLEESVPKGQEFGLGDGRRLHSLLDLKIALRTMPDEVFAHHVSATKNDFASWIRGSLKENAIADEIAKLRDKHQIEQYLSRMAG